MTKWLALSLAVVAAAVTGCQSGPPKNAAMKEDLDALEQRMNRKLDESLLKIERELPGVQSDYAKMKQLHQDIKNALDDLRKTNEDVKGALSKVESKHDEAKKAVVRVLEEEEKLLVDRLASLRATLEEMKKK